MKRSPAENAQIKQFREFLKQNPRTRELSSKTVGTYIGALTVDGTLTGGAKDGGCLPDGTESLMAMTDQAQIEAVAAWWKGTGRNLFVKFTPPMNHWLNFHGIKDSSAPDVTQLARPAHGVTLRLVLEGFLAGAARKNAGAGTAYSLVLETLTGTWFQSARLQEDNKEFLRLWNSLRDQIDDAPELMASCLTEDYAHVKDGCRSAVEHVLKECGDQLLLFLQKRPIPYDNSLLPRLEQLRTICQTPDASEHQCALALLPLLRAVLLDCLPNRWTGSAELAAGAALADPRFWDTGLIWEWITRYPLSQNALEILIRLPGPRREEQKNRLAAVMLRSMLALAEDGAEEANEEKCRSVIRWMEEAVVFCREHWTQLKQGLQTSEPDWYAAPKLSQRAKAWFEAVPEPELLGRAGGSVYYARLLCRQAELLLALPRGTLSKARYEVRLACAQGAVWAGQSAIRKRRENRPHHETIETASGHRSLHKTWARLQLCDAAAYLRYAQLEVEENCLSDVLEMYIKPSRRALACAGDNSVLTNEEWQELRPRWKGLCQECFNAFFGPKSPIVQRLRLLPETDDRDYQREYHAWTEDFGSVLTVPRTAVPSAPSVHLPLDPALLRDPNLFQPVYSGVFDSVLGKNNAQQTPVELATFQLLSDSMTCLLQMNQVVDNLAVLRMLHVPGYRAACREGIITLSCFWEIHNPRLYLEKNLRDPKFRFSSTVDFAVPEDATGDTLKNSCRGVMLRYLNGQAALSDFPSDCDRGRMEFLAESYRLMMECFQHSDLRRYHQNPAYRYPPRQWASAPPRELHEVLMERLDLLLAAARRPGSCKNLTKLEQLRKCALQLGELPYRATYDKAIDDQLEISGDPIWESLRSVVHRSYFISNGSRSCDNILFTERDPDLTLEAEEGPDQSENDGLEYLYRQAWRPGTNENIGWPDICEIALINREVDLRGQDMSLDRRIAQKERETGMGYHVQNGTIVADRYTAKLAYGPSTQVSPAQADDADTQFLEMRKRG